MDEQTLGGYLGFSYFLGIGPIRFKRLKSHLGGVLDCYNSPRNKLEQLLGYEIARKFCEFRNKFNPEEEIKRLKKLSITPLTQEGERYPTALKNISDPPICLFIKGNLTNWNLNENKYFIAIVGTRAPTAYGISVTRMFSSELTSSGFVIVSGMAYGIDTAAHAACLTARGKTIAFLGCGVDIIYPQGNHNLYKNIISSGGLIVSEFPPGRTVLKGLFVARNRLISGLSRGVIVVEGTKDSGSLITARFAAEQGKTVFAPPSPITSPMSGAPNLLLKEGARLISSVADILDEFNLKLSPRSSRDIQALLDPAEQLLFDALKNEAQTVDDLVFSTKLSPQTVLNILSLLEMRELVEKNIQGNYQAHI